MQGYACEKLDSRELHFRIPGPVAGLQLFLRYLPPAGGREVEARPVLFVHGMSFPSALSIAHRMDGRSWRDELCDAGFAVWGLDFYGFGFSDRYVEMSRPAEENPPLGPAEEAARQVECAARFICEYQQSGSRQRAVSLIAHSAGAVAAACFAVRMPELVERLVFFAPIAQRKPVSREQKALPAWRLVAVEEQWARFIEDVPKGEPGVLRREHFDDWGPRYLDSDPESRTRSPHSVKIPEGLRAEIFAAWDGHLAYDPAKIRAPVAIIRGEWDSLCTDADAAWLFRSLSSPVKRDIKISRATHLMHLEDNRFALYREAQTFLEGDHP